MRRFFVGFVLLVCLASIVVIFLGTQDQKPRKNKMPILNSFEDEAIIKERQIRTLLNESKLGIIDPERYLELKASILTQPQHHRATGMPVTATTLKYKQTRNDTAPKYDGGKSSADNQQTWDAKVQNTNSSSQAPPLPNNKDWQMASQERTWEK